MIANHHVNLRLKLYLAGVPQPEVVVLEEEGVGPACHVLQVTEVPPIKLASEQTFEKVSFGHFVPAVDVVGVIVQRFEVVEGSRILVEEVPQEGGAAPPRGQDQRVPGVVLQTIHWFYNRVSQSRRRPLLPTTNCSNSYVPISWLLAVG